jgi:hypothetical protein
LTSFHKNKQILITVSEHNVMHEVDRVIQWTLQVQAPTLADPVACGCGKKTAERIEGKKKF